MIRTLTRSLVGVAVLSGVLTVGAAGVASAAQSSSTGAAASTATHAARCTKAEALATKIEKREKQAQTWLPNAQKREDAALAANHKKLAARIARRIARVQKLVPKGEKVLAKIAQKCGSVTPPASGSTPS
jgi:hypothetical protein